MSAVGQSYHIRLGDGSASASPPPPRTVALSAPRRNNRRHMASTPDLPARPGSAGGAPHGGAPAPLPPPASQDQPAGAGGTEHSTRHSVVVFLILFGLIVATGAMVVFIWHRWSRVQEPTTAVIIEGDESIEGTSITVRGMGRQVTTTIQRSEGFVAPVLLEPGRYWVTATRDGQSILRKEVQVKRFLGVRFNLAEFVRQAQAQGLLPPATTKPVSATNRQTENP